MTTPNVTFKAKDYVTAIGVDNEGSANDFVFVLDHTTGQSVRLSTADANSSGSVFLDSFKDNTFYRDFDDLASVRITAPEENLFPGVLPDPVYGILDRSPVFADHVTDLVMMHLALKDVDANAGTHIQGDGKLWYQGEELTMDQVKDAVHEALLGTYVPGTGLQGGIYLELLAEQAAGQTPEFDYHIQNLIGQFSNEMSLYQPPMLDPFGI